ncbi:amino acid-binding ACT domain-containing protein [Brucella abortus]|uniref:amino acid-binding ACT domain-containing protein n=1 Tax=Brucella abortus TaxID=235 RepID=UPI000E19156A|nr:amino acid-binding ACT domain-containing protein [Brucella abortus]SUW23150.1 protein YdjB [Brucella abortus]
MYDLQFHLMNRPGTLAELGEAMGRAGVPFEGGGVFSNGDQAIAHFLFLDGEAAARAAAEAGVNVLVQYSDHRNRLVLICDQEDVARRVTEEWSVGDDLPIEAQ